MKFVLPLGPAVRGQVFGCICIVFFCVHTSVVCVYMSLCLVTCYSVQQSLLWCALWVGGVRPACLLCGCTAPAAATRRVPPAGAGPHPSSPHSCDEYVSPRVLPSGRVVYTVYLVPCTTFLPLPSPSLHKFRSRYQISIQTITTDIICHFVSFFQALFTNLNNVNNNTLILIYVIF